MAEGQIREIIEAQGYHLNPARGEEMRMPCLFHADSDKKGHLYINCKEGLYFCHVCGEKGNGKLLAKFFNVDWVDEDTGEVFGGKPREEFFNILKVNDEALAYYQQQLIDHPNVLKYLRIERGLKMEIIERAKLGYAPNVGLVRHMVDKGFTMKELKQSGLVRDDGQEFYRDKIIIPYLSSGHAVQLRGKQIGGKYIGTANQDTRIYGLDSVKDSDEILVCEGEFDSLAARQLGFTAVGIPGAKGFKEEWLSWFEGFRRVYIVFDNEQSEVGEEGAEKVKQIIGKRARIVTLPRPDHVKKVDLNDWMLSGGTYEQMIDLMHASDGKRLQRAPEIRQRWKENQNRDDGFYFGLHPRWDHYSQPGFTPGMLITMLAKTGAGKTVTMLNIAYQNRTVPQVMVSLEQTAEELYERMRRISLFYNPKLTDDEVDEQWSKILICDENKMTGKDFEDLLFEYEEEVGEYPKLAWVDYLGYFARGYKGEEYMRLSDAVMDLKAMAKKHKIVIFSPHQVNRTAKDGKLIESDMARGSGVIEETSDYCFALWKPYEAESNDGAEPGETKVKVLKSRLGGKGNVYQMYQAPQSLAMVPNDNVQLRNMVMSEYQAFEKGHLWPEIHEARKALGIIPKDYR